MVPSQEELLAGYSSRSQTNLSNVGSDALRQNRYRRSIYPASCSSSAPSNPVIAMT